MQFIPQVSPRFKEPLHLAPIVEALQRTLEGPQRLIFTVPSQHYKTETVLHFIAWYLRQRPEHPVGYVSYSQRQATSKALKAQRYCEAAGIEPDPRMANLAEWRTVEGGGILSTGIGGPLTGQEIKVLIIDDPTKNRLEAESPLVQQAQWAWYEDVAEERLHDDSSVIIVMTRWALRDLAGRVQLERPGEFEVVRIPALADGLDAEGKKPAPDPLGREIGEPLLPEVHGKEKLEREKRRKPLTFAAMRQGLPRPRAEVLFGEPTFYQKLPETGLRFSVGADLAYSTKSRADHTAIVILAGEGEGEDLKAYVVRVIRGRWPIGRTIRILKAVQAIYPVPIAVEANGPQKGIADTLEDNGLLIERTNPVGDKYARAQDPADVWNAGELQVPLRRTPWLPALLTETQDFTGSGDEDDDQVDGLGLAWRQLRTPGPAMAFV
jgi:predicted phage terminase large subunit-like protein